MKKPYVIILFTIFNLNLFAPAGAKFQGYPQTITTLSLQDFLDTYPSATCAATLVDTTFTYPSFPVTCCQGHPEYTMSGNLQDINILTLMNPEICIDTKNLLYINHSFINEFVQKKHAPEYLWGARKPLCTKNEPTVLSGTVAVLHHYAQYVYGHFIFDILGQLALLEMQGYSYDYLYVKYDSKYMQELLHIWGIPKEKIINSSQNPMIQADIAIISTPLSCDTQKVRISSFYPPQTLRYVREKVLNNISDLKQRMQKFPPKIFISRKDAMYRNLPNEDEIFDVFKACGYVRFCPSNYSVADQVALFCQATHIAGAAGSNMTNMIFAKPTTRYVEFMQVMPDTTFYVMALIFNLDYCCIWDSTLYDIQHGGSRSPGRNLNPQLVRDFLNNHPDF